MIFWKPVTSLNNPIIGHEQIPSEFDHIMIYLVPAVWGIGSGALYAAVNSELILKKRLFYREFLSIFFY